MTSAVVGAIEHAVSKGLSEEGIQLLAEATKSENSVRANGKYLPIAKIQNVEHPVPGMWRVPFERVATVLKQGFISTKEEKLKVPCAYIHNGDEFVWIKNEAGKESAVKWDHVEKYELITG